MSSLALSPVLLQLQRQPGPLLPQIQAALAAHGQPLRWAITAVPEPGALQIEAVVLTHGTAAL